MSVELKTISSGYSTGLINENFQQLADLLNNNFLNRDGLDEGDPNQMELDLDMNGNEILNVGYGSENGLVPKSYVDAGDAANSAEVDALATVVDGYVAALQADDNALAQALAQEIAARIAGDLEFREDFTAADANLQAQISGGAPLEASAFSPISWHDQSVDNSVNIPDNQNAWSFGPTMTISSGSTVTVGSDSFWTIANGEVQ